MKDLENTVIGAITIRMPRNEHGEIIDKCLHSDLINAVNEAFALYNVVGQSEQLKEFVKWQKKYKDSSYVDCFNVDTYLNSL
jgi:hypothetical protein